MSKVATDLEFALRTRDFILKRADELLALLGTARGNINTRQNTKLSIEELKATSKIEWLPILAPEKGEQLTQQIAKLEERLAELDKDIGPLRGDDIDAASGKLMRASQRLGLELDLYQFARDERDIRDLVSGKPYRRRDDSMSGKFGARSDLADFIPHQWPLDKKNLERGDILVYLASQERLQKIILSEGTKDSSQKNRFQLEVDYQSNTVVLIDGESERKLGDLQTLKDVNMARREDGLIFLLDLDPNNNDAPQAMIKFKQVEFIPKTVP